ncbi:nuclear transport factor 2 family protein [Belnapia sp. T6]|uniref:Nuclear transport factor 2 family protein n=1 Tax=Belnapia mucosa TaxID=2804532 RepID=A0ABS1V4M4_9PROT|nr:nuclear transport factor 2 family protein [Belnapia mucosa]MBL6456202.1 nuclear transport factor 2 family protein [Belnapia mucosa]
MIARRSFAALAAMASLLTVGTARAQSADQAALTQAVDALNKAMVDVDQAKLDALTADELSYGHSAGRIETKRQFIDYLVSRQSAFRFINTSDQTISVVGTDAIVRHIFVAETTDPAGKVTPVRIGILQVWTRRGSDWRLLARQAYRL